MPGIAKVCSECTLGINACSIISSAKDQKCPLFNCASLTELDWNSLINICKSVTVTKKDVTVEYTDDNIIIALAYTTTGPGDAKEYSWLSKTALNKDRTIGVFAADMEYTVVCRDTLYVDMLATFIMLTTGIA